MTDASSASGFAEDRAAAQSQKNAWTRLASTYSLIRVELDGRTLRVAPRSTLTRWLLQGLGLDLVHAISLDRILSAEHEGDWGNYGKVLISFHDDAGAARKLRLYLKGWQRLIGALVAQGVAVRG